MVWNYLKQNRLKCLLVAAILFFLVLYCWFPFQIWRQAGNFNEHYIFSWPDETANFFFAQNFAEHFSLNQPELLNTIVKNVVHPRSFNIAGENLVPMGFIGLPVIFGAIGFFIGSGQVVFLTPLLALLSLGLFFLLLKRFFSTKLSALGVFILGSSAGWIYYSSVSMLSELPFIAFFLAGLCSLLYGLSAIKDTNQKRLIILAGFLTALAFFIRTSEVAWTMFLYLIPLVVYRKLINWKKVKWFFYGMIPVVVIALVFNYLTFGKIFALGYFNLQADGDWKKSLPTGIEANGLFKYAKLFLLPFGFHPRLAWHNFYNYFIVLFWPYFSLMTLGVGVFIWNWIKKKTEKSDRVFFVAMAAAFGWLVIYYGSMVNADQLVLRENTIGISYVRYWIPLFLFSIPATLYFFKEVFRVFHQHTFNVAFIALNVLLLFVFSINLAFFASGDGLRDQKKTIAEYYNQAREVQKKIGSDQLVVVERADKVLFPMEKVVVFNTDFSVFEKLAPILNSRKIYYFTMRSDNEINEMNAKKLQPLGMRAEFPQKIDAKFSLYELVWVPKNN